jgi:hypothetical protein
MRSSTPHNLMIHSNKQQTFITREYRDNLKKKSMIV